MKTIVTYASTGGGHLRAAEAIFNYIKEYCPEQDLQIADVLEHSSVFFRVTYRWGYSFLVRHLGLFWQVSFWFTDSKLLRPFSRPIASFLNKFNTFKFADFLAREKPDIIISTHFLPSEITSNLKVSGKLNCNLTTIITDFRAHSFWVCPGTNNYIVASELTKQQLFLEGVSVDDIKVLGIPVDAKFTKRYDRERLVEKFGLDKDKFTILIMTGSFGLGPLERIVDVLHMNAQILIVCASNKSLYSRLQKKKLPDVRVFGFIDNPEELMAASDIIITKPGGLTIAEITSMELVPIFISAIPGQEAGNIEVLNSYGIGLSAQSTLELKKLVLDLKRHPEKLKIMKSNFSNIKKPDALKEILNVVCESGVRACG